MYDTITRRNQQKFTQTHKQLLSDRDQRYIQGKLAPLEKFEPVTVSKQQPVTSSNKRIVMRGNLTSKMQNDNQTQDATLIEHQ